MAKRTPNLFLNIWNNIKHNHFKNNKANLIGADYLGNKYYEIPAEPQRGKRKPSRWFENDKGFDGFDNEKPAEWESWLRMRRMEPPSEEEIKKNLAISEMKKINAAELEKKYLDPSKANQLSKETTITGIKSFPNYDEFK